MKAGAYEKPKRERSLHTHSTAQAHVPASFPVVLVLVWRAAASLCVGVGGWVCACGFGGDGVCA